MYLSLSLHPLLQITVVKEVLPPEEPPQRPIGGTDLNKIQVETVFLNLETNHSAHHTDRYDYDGLIVRRGQSFSLTLNTKDPLPPGKSNKLMCTLCVIVCNNKYIDWAFNDLSACVIV